jgi:hypothetical protein
MGRWPYSNRKTVEECLCLDVFKLRGASVFNETQVGTWSVSWGENDIALWFRSSSVGPWLELSYAITRPTDEKSKLHYSIELETTSCNFGGSRYWFICSLSLDWLLFQTSQLLSDLYPDL